MDKREKLKDFLYNLTVEVLKEMGLVEKEIEDEQKIKIIEKLIREGFSDGLIKVRQETAGWILTLLDNKIGKTIIKIWIYRQFKKAIIEQLKEMQKFSKRIKKNFNKHKKMLYEWESILTEDINQIEKEFKKEINKKKKSKTTIH